jgi:tryptophan synthase alpha subunit
MDLIACLGAGKGTWGHVNKLISDYEWNNIFLVTNEFGKENFNPTKKAEFIVVDYRRGIRELRDEIQEKLKEKVKEMEVGLNFVSGIGREHMALISALLKLGIGIRLFAVTKEGVEEI